MEHTLNSARMPWSHQHHIDDGSDTENARAQINNAKIYNKKVGLSIRPSRGRMSMMLSEATAQMQSPTVPRNLFFDAGPLSPFPPPSLPMASMPAPPVPALPTMPMPSLPSPPPPPPPPQPAFSRDSVIMIDHNLPLFDLDFAPIIEGGYELNPSFMQAWEEKNNGPPVEQAPKTLTNKSSRLVDMPESILFPRPGDDDYKGSDGEAAAELVPYKSPRAKKASRAAEMAAAGIGSPMNVGKRSTPRSASGWQAPSYQKRNFSLPVALIPTMPRLELQSYEFSCIERLERKWADVKTESTRMLSSAIYKYYFSHGEWSEFEQVFPNKVLEVWEDFCSKLSAAELSHINTVLVSQNPFSAGENTTQEKHIPLLARTIPLSQAVRTMVYAEDMRSRESYSSQGSSGPEIDQEFADWLVSRFNSTKASVVSPSPSVLAFDETRAQRVSMMLDMSAPSLVLTGGSDKVPPVPALPPVRPAPIVYAAAAEPTTFSTIVEVSEDVECSAAPISNKLKADSTAVDSGTEARPKSSRERTKKPNKKTESMHDSKASLVIEKPRRKKTIDSGDKSDIKDPLGKRESKHKSKRESRREPKIEPLHEPKSESSHKQKTESSHGHKRESKRDPKRASKRESRREPVADYKTDSEEPVPTISWNPSMSFPAMEQPSRRPSTSIPSSSKPLTTSESNPCLRPTTASRNSEAADGTATTRPRSDSRLRRHTHNFFMSESNEFVVPTESLRLSRQITREIQMKDLPPLPPNAAEIGEMSKLTGSNYKAGRNTAPSTKSGIIAHFSSHVDLVRRKDASMDKPRSSSMAIDSLEKARPMTAVPKTEESRTSKGCSEEYSLSANYDLRAIPAEGNGPSWGFRISSLVYLEPMERAKMDTSSHVVHAHIETMNRRKLPDPQKDTPPIMPPMPAMPAESMPQPLLSASKSLRGTRRKSVSKADQPPSGSGSNSSGTSTSTSNGSRPQAGLGLGLSSTTSTTDSNKAVDPGVRGALYELAYLSTQSKKVWSAKDTIFGKMLKAGLEVTRIAEQDFYDFCVDELLKGSNDAFHDLQAMGNKEVAQQLFESFNARLTVLLSGSDME
ncbi:hypothetical protein GGF37_000643 [Kickxella alabastrina]|nr:hypothetical protein GGF37_000643 [Kickxella alabastrina]